MPHDDRAEGLIVFAQQPNHLVRSDPARKGGEAAQVAEDDGDLGATAVRRPCLAGKLDEFGDLRRQEALEAGDALRSLVGRGKKSMWSTRMPARTPSSSSPV